MDLPAVAGTKEQERPWGEEAREAARALKELEAATAEQQKTVDPTSPCWPPWRRPATPRAQHGRGSNWPRPRQPWLRRTTGWPTPAGCVYVISHRRAFEKRMVKIGMTRRLDPMNRIKELGEDSAPFIFGVHAPFFSQGAGDIETMLHRHFAAQPVNRVNLRRKYFYATPKTGPPPWRSTL